MRPMRLGGWPFSAFSSGTVNQSAITSTSGCGCPRPDRSLRGRSGLEDRGGRGGAGRDVHHGEPDTGRGNGCDTAKSKDDIETSTGLDPRNHFLLDRLDILAPSIQAYFIQPPSLSGRHAFSPGTVLRIL